MAKIDTAKTKYKNKIRAARAANKYAKGMARFFGVDVARITGSTPVEDWNSFDVDTAADTWEKNLKAAFGLE